MSTAKLSKLKRRLNWSLVFIVAVYIPFLVFLSLKFNTTQISLSKIGWQKGYLRYLFYYVLFTVPFMILQAMTFTTLTERNNKLLKSLVFVSGLLIFAGSVFPITTNAPAISHFMHNTLCQIGSLLSVIAVTYMISLYCKKGKVNTKKVAILYAELLVCVVISLGIFRAAAIFELGASLLFLITMHGMNSTLSKTTTSFNESFENDAAFVQQTSQLANN